MTIERTLTVPEGYDAAAHPRVASFAGQLEDQRERLAKDVAGLEVRHLEWQPQPGVNTIGMLLAHLAVVEVWWIRLAPHETPEPECDALMTGIIGIHMDDDGLPLASDGRHPEPLAGKSLDDYMRMLAAARAVTHQELRGWTDDGLSTTYTMPERIISREWTVYHVLEHFCAHYGQITLLKHLMRDAGLLPAPGT